MSVNTTICVCRQQQSTVFDPVCGTDGRTYSNVDEMKFENCQKMRTTEVQHRGSCGKYSVGKILLFLPSSYMMNCKKTTSRRFPIVLYQLRVFKVFAQVTSLQPQVNNF